MLVVVDSGSTKADWKFIANADNIQLRSTRGFNPFLHPTEEIYQAVIGAFEQEDVLDKVREIHYYGAGCSDAYRCSIVAKALEKAFSNAKIVVDHDLLAAARATLDDQPGIACILGTGSNSCSYNGEKVMDNVTNLGHILGDEGSGCHLGKALITAYFYREMPADLAGSFESQYTNNKRAILNDIYGSKPNVYLASFSRFISQNQDHPFMRKLIGKCFGEFIERHITKYTEYTHHPVCFVGSISYYFSAILEEELSVRGLRLGKVVQKPIDALVFFHLKQFNF